MLFVENKFALTRDFQAIERLAVSDANLMFSAFEQAAAREGPYAHPPGIERTLQLAPVIAKRTVKLGIVRVHR